MLEPEKKLRDLSSKVCKEISLKIKNCGHINFAEFMQMALYLPDIGYYNNDCEKLGATGDFITAPELGSLFAETLFVQIKEIIAQTGITNILEIGPGNGTLAAQLLELISTEKIENIEYTLLDISPKLRANQQKKLLPKYNAKIHWLNSWPKTPKPYIIIANEWLDAIPVNIIEKTPAGLRECTVNFDDYFFWAHSELGAKLKQVCKKLEQVLTRAPFGYRTEVSTQLDSSLAYLANIMTTGIILLIDYGFPRHEYYHPSRNKGTLMCHYKHRTHADPFYYPGLQDITSHIDFSSIKDYGEKLNLDILGFTNMAAFLLNCGIDKILANYSCKTISRDLTMQARTLCDPHEMGELFKVIALGKNIDIPLLGFSNFDKSATL